MIVYTQAMQGIQMSYLKDFQTQISNHDYPACLRLWEEYCSSDEIDPQELALILRAMKESNMNEAFGRHVEKILPLWSQLSDSPFKHEAIKLIFDLQTTNSAHLADFALDYLKDKYPNDKTFNEKIRLVGLRTRDNFQGALSSYELLTHMAKGKFVFHTGGWGVGEILDVSFIREQLSLEFDFVAGKKDLSFANAFKTLIPIPDNHFLAMRFGRADDLEKKAKEDPTSVMHMLLRDLGPKTAAEIKDELCELVIPADEWQRWWQLARTKLKKDTLVESPEDPKEPFRLRNQQVSHEERLTHSLENKPDAETLIQMVYSFLKDFPEILKNEEFKMKLASKIQETLSYSEIIPAQELQIHFFLQDLHGARDYPNAGELIKKISSIEEIIKKIDILAFKKRCLVEARKHRKDWKDIFLRLFLTLGPAPLRDYIFSELIEEGSDQEIKTELEKLCNSPSRNPDAFLWYFNKVASKAEVPFSDEKGQARFFEAFLILLSHLEQIPEERNTVKKMHSILSSGRYAIVRQIMAAATGEEVKEFLLLATKCHSLGDHDIKIFHSLAEVAHPNLVKGRKKQEKTADADTLWTTQEGYIKLQARIQQIGTVETIENAKEIEVARSHGDLRENQEFKAALQKRGRLQEELKRLSDQLNRSRILTPADVTTDKVDIGTVVECTNKKGEKIVYTILGPLDADPDRFIISFQSKLAQEMKGLKVGEKFKFQGEEYTVQSIRSYFE